MSEQRLDQTLEIVETDFGELVELRQCDVMPVEDTLPARRPRRREPHFERVQVEDPRPVGEVVHERMRRWLDEPHQSLAGRTPRDAASGSQRAEVVRMLRQIENSAERARRRGEPSIDAARLGAELGLDDGELAA